MKFGKLEDVSEVDFKLPLNHSFNEEILAEAKEESNAAFKVYIGATGWGMPAWKGKWYPSKTPVKSFLSAYAKQFNAIELNATYYGMPKESTLENWILQTPSDFRFFPKVPQSISTSKFPIEQLDRMQYFLDQCNLLGNKFERAFLQLSPYQGKVHFYRLLELLDQVKDSNRIYLEFRAEEIYADKDFLNTMIKELFSRKIGLLLTDVSGRRDLMHMALTKPEMMIRFVGNDLHPSDFQRLDEWIIRIKHWKDQGVKSIYFFVHQPDNLHAPNLAYYLAKNLMLSIRDVELRGPTEIVDPTPSLF